MAVSTAYSVLSSAGNGSTTAFPVTWPFFTGTLVVTLVASTGVETVKTLTTDYTVTGGTDANGLPATGTVTMLTAPSSGETLRITRVTTKTQATQWNESDGFPEKTVEAALDKLTLLAQEAALPGTVNDGIGGDVMELVTSGATDYWDAESHIIRNVADATASTDAVNYGQLQDALVAGGAGDVVGPASSTDDRIVTFDGVTGKILQDGGKTIAEVEAAAAATALASVRNGASAGYDTLAEIETALGTKAPSTSGSSVLKGDGAGGTTAAAATDLGAGRHAIWLPAGFWTPRTTNGAALGATELATNDVMLRSYDFDTTTEEGIGGMIAMPKSWNEGTVTYQAFWTAASGSGGVAFGVAGYAFSNDDAMDTAPSGQQIVTDTLITANDMHISEESSAITIGGTPAAGDVVYFEVTREVGDASDTLAVDAKLLGIMLYITTDAITDA